MDAHKSSLEFVGRPT